MELFEHLVFAKGPGYDCESFPHVVENNIYVVRYPESTVGTAIFLHGTASDVGTCRERVDALRAAGYGVYAPEYPGYNDNRKPSEKGLHVAAEAAYNVAINDGHKHITVFGYSLGSLAACHLAINVDISHLVLVSAFSSIANILKDTGLFDSNTAEFLPAGTYENITKLSAYSGNVTIIHGAKDNFILPSHADTLFKCCPSESKQLVMLPDNDHHITEWENNVIPYI